MSQTGATSFSHMWKLTSLSDLGDVLDDPDRLRVRVFSRVVGVQAVDVGHEEKVVGVDHVGRDGGQGVVVAELDLL